MMLHEPRAIQTFVYNGLGNRLLAIASTLRLVDKGYFETAYIGWEPTFDLHVQMDELLRIDRRLLPHEYPHDNVVVVTDGVVPHIPLRANLAINAWSQFIIWGDDTPKATLDREWHQAFRDVHFHHKFWRDLPVEGRVGLHCRRSDRVKGDEALSGQWDRDFADQVEAHYLHEPLFLATDSPSTKDYFKMRFGHRLLTADIVNYPVAANRNRWVAEEAVVDLWLLSRCQRIVGDHWSTFSWAAALFGGIPHIYWPRPL